MRELELINALTDFFIEVGREGVLTKESIFYKDDLDSFDKMNLLVLLEEFSERELSITEVFECELISDICNLCFDRSLDYEK